MSKNNRPLSPRIFQQCASVIEESCCRRVNAYWKARTSFNNLFCIKFLQLRTTETLIANKFLLLHQVLTHRGIFVSLFSFDLLCTSFGSVFCNSDFCCAIDYCFSLHILFGTKTDCLQCICPNEKIYEALIHF